MRNSKYTLWLGVWLFIVPFLGIPSAWKEILMALTGLALLLFVAVRRWGSWFFSGTETPPDTHGINGEVPDARSTGALHADRGDAPQPSPEQKTSDTE